MTRTRRMNVDEVERILERYVAKRMETESFIKSLVTS